MTAMVRSHGWSERGKRLVMDAPFGHWLTQTFIAALSCDGLYAPRGFLTVPCVGQALTFISKLGLAPILVKGDVVICDNLERF